MFTTWVCLELRISITTIVWCSQHFCLILFSKTWVSEGVSHTVRFRSLTSLRFSEVQTSSSSSSFVFLVKSNCMWPRSILLHDLLTVLLAVKMALSLCSRRWISHKWSCSWDWILLRCGCGFARRSTDGLVLMCTRMSLSICHNVQPLGCLMWTVS